MSIAWASIAIILLILPGIFFFIGLATWDRLSREIIRSSVISEVALAVVIAGLIHFGSICLISTTGFRLAGFILPLVQFNSGKITPELFVSEIDARSVKTVVYLGVTTLLGFGLGLLVAEGVVAGPLRWLSRHRWIYDIIDADRKRVIITAYVMTDIIEEAKIIMYKGRLHDIFLGDEGSISYLILKNCSRYYMTFKDGELITSKQLSLFGANQTKRPPNVWDRLLIEGKNISNVLFDSSRELKGEAESLEILDEAFREALRERLHHLTYKSPRSN